MNTRMIMGALLTAAGFDIIALCYLGVRNPKAPKWAEDTLMGGIILPLSLGSCVMGLMLIFEGLIKYRAQLSAIDILVTLGILAGGVAIIFMMRIKKRVAAYDALRNAPEIIALQSKRQGAGTSDTPITPVDRAA